VVEPEHDGRATRACNLRHGLTPAEGLR
jgi:hypothetical protein